LQIVIPAQNFPGRGPEDPPALTLFWVARDFGEPAFPSDASSTTTTTYRFFRVSFQKIKRKKRKLSQERLLSEKTPRFLF
jgi:hypothetical protein